ncbi:MAG: flagellar biosynthetic protein FliO [Planctomycetota bacterium]|jgi:flagellar biosynthetic protein FliO|nr:flagellar biosynthetic protein FliO [Planctomycetota bacterium]
MHALTTALITEAGANTGPDLTRYFAVCGVLLGAIALLAWGFKKLIAGNLTSRASKRNLQILDVLPMGGKQKLAVVRCYDRAFLIGLGDKEISSISELDGVIANEAETKAPADKESFEQALDLISRAMPGRKARATKSQGTTQGIGELVG